MKLKIIVASCAMAGLIGPMAQAETVVQQGTAYTVVPSTPAQVVTSPAPAAAQVITPQPGQIVVIPGSQAATPVAVQPAQPVQVIPAMAKLMGEVESTDLKNRTIKVKINNEKSSDIQVPKTAHLTDRDYNDRAINLKDIDKGDSVMIEYNPQTNVASSVSRTAHMNLQ